MKLKLKTQNHSNRHIFNFFRDSHRIVLFAVISVYLPTKWRSYFIPSSRLVESPRGWCRDLGSEERRIWNLQYSVYIEINEIRIYFSTRSVVQYITKMKMNRKYLQVYTVRTQHIRYAGWLGTKRPIPNKTLHGFEFH